MAGMARVVPSVLILGALLGDATGSRAHSLMAPAGFESRCSLLRPMLTGLSLALLVLSAALRSPAVVGGVPALATSALVLALLLYGAVVIGALLPESRTVPGSA